MNCKPGDMAIVVRPFDYLANTYFREPFPRPGTVVQVTLLQPDGVTWSLAESVFYRAECKVSGSWWQCHIDGIDDSILRPLNDKPSDEEVRDLYAPKVPEVA